MEGEKERKYRRGTSAVMAVRRSFSATYSIITLFEKRGNHFINDGRFPANGQGQPLFCFSVDYVARDQRGNMGKRQPPLYLPVYLYCQTAYSPPSSLCLILRFSVSLLAFSLASEYASLSSDTLALQLVRIGSNQSYAK